MQSIGERLEEARKRGGISLREASEATKIRPDYLQLMEGNNFSFNVPEVYKRGFLKIYCRYLKLDADKIAADYTAQALGAGHGSRRDARDTLGRMDAPGRDGGDGGAEPQYSGAPAGGLETQPGGENGDRAALVRLVVGLVIAAAALVGLTIFLSSLMNSGGTTDTGAPPSQQASDAPATTPPGTTPPAGTGIAPPPPVPVAVQLRFTAKEDISNLTVRQRSDGKELYNGQLRRGQGVSATGPVQVQVTQAENLTVETNGTPSTLGRPGGGVLSGPATFNWPPPGYSGGQ